MLTRHSSVSNEQNKERKKTEREKGKSHGRDVPSLPLLLLPQIFATQLFSAIPPRSTSQPEQINTKGKMEQMSQQKCV